MYSKYTYDSQRLPKKITAICFSVGCFSFFSSNLEHLLAGQRGNPASLAHSASPFYIEIINYE